MSAHKINFGTEKMSYTNTNHKFVFVYHKHKQSFGIAPISEVTPSLFVDLRGHTFLPIISRVTRDNQKLVYFLVNSSRLCVLSRKFISHITLTFRFNLTSHAKYIVPCGVSLSLPSSRSYYRRIREE